MAKEEEFNGALMGESGKPFLAAMEVSCNTTFRLGFGV